MRNRNVRRPFPILPLQQELCRAEFSADTTLLQPLSSSRCVSTSRQDSAPASAPRFTQVWAITPRSAKGLSAGLAAGAEEGEAGIRAVYRQVEWGTTTLMEGNISDIAESPID